jgi:hypothetical protein
MNPPGFVPPIGPVSLGPIQNYLLLLLLIALLKRLGLLPTDENEGGFTSTQQVIDRVAAINPAAAPLATQWRDKLQAGQSTLIPT